MRRISFVIISMLCACSTERDLPALPDILIETEHFRYYHQEGDVPCPAVLDRLERHYLAVSGHLDADLLGGHKIDYYSFNEGDCRAYCGAPDGCFEETSVYASSLGLFPNGLVRAYLSCLGSPPEFFSAGAANFLAAGFSVPWTTIPEGVPLLDLFTDKAFRDSAGWPENVSRDDLAGSFSRLLVDRHGVDAYLAMYSNLDKQMSFDEIDAVFLAVFGETLGNAHAEWQDLLPRDTYIHHLFLLECDGEAHVLPAEGPVLVSGELDCWRDEITIRVQSGDLELRSLERSRLFFWPCAAEGGEPHTMGLSEVGTHWLKLPPGDYFVQIEPPIQEDYPTRFEFALEGRTGIIADQAEQAELQHISPPASYQILANNASLADDYLGPSHPGATDAVLRFTLDEPARLSVHDSWDPAWVFLCPDDALADDARCTLLDQQSQMLDAGIPYRLFIETMPEDFHLLDVSLDFRLPQ